MMTIVIVTLMPVLVLVIARVITVLVVVMVRRPCWKWIWKLGPAMFAGDHLRVIQQAGIKLRLKFSGIEFDSHEGNSLAAVAEGFPPFFSRPVPHLGFPGMLVTSSPPFSSSGMMRFRTCLVKAADQVHSCGEPEETFGAEDTRKAALQQIPKPLGVEWFPGAIGERCYVIVFGRAGLLRID